MPSSAVTRRTLMASGATLAAAALVPLAARADEVVAPSGKVFAKYIP